MKNLTSSRVYVDLNYESTASDTFVSFESDRDFGTAVILITHNLGVAAGLTQKIAVMYAGKIVEQGTVEAVYNNPQND